MRYPSSRIRKASMSDQKQTKGLTFIKKPLSKGVANVPVIIQLEALECGAAALDMILAYYQKWIPLEQVRLDCGVSRDGSKAVNLLKAARHYGLEAKGYRYEPQTLKEKGRFPCIIHWNFNHFVVLCGFKKDKAVINDPARGRIEVPMDEFDRSFTGICLFFEPSPEFKPSGKRKSMAKSARKKLQGTGEALTLVIITTVITSLIGIIKPGFSQVFADRLLTGKNPNWFVPFLVLLTILAVIEICMVWINTVYAAHASGKIATLSNVNYMWHVFRLPMDFFSQRLVADIVRRKNQNTEIAETLVNSLAPLAIQIAMLLFYLFIMIRYSWILTLVGVLSIFINMAVSLYISNKRIDVMRLLARDKVRLTSTSSSGLSMIETIKAAGAENGFFSKWAGIQASVSRSEAQKVKVNRTIGIVPEVLSTFTTIVVLMGGVWLCMRGDWTVGMITAFTGFLSALFSPANEIIEALQSFQELRINMERVEDVMQYPIDILCQDPDPAVVNEEEELNKLGGKIEVKNVTFGYFPLDKPLIENFSMSLEPGQRVALVGPSGCGKSTLSKLISGLYQPWSGEILFDGKPLKDINRNVFTGSVSVVDQDIILFEDTIANNIKLWDKSIEDFEMILAARDAKIHEDIIQREKGYNHVLLEGGRDFSGGQCQRLEIARVLAQDPTIIVMDEATSALDAKTEEEVINSIVARGITCIIVAHRLSTIRDCDEIIVFDHGKVVERGKHEELYAKNGFYTQLVSNQ